MEPDDILCCRVKTYRKARTTEKRKKERKKEV
jgi:hypothetical protein